METNYKIAVYIDNKRSEGQEVNLARTSFEGLDLSYVDFSGVNLTRSLFDRAILRGANFANANLSRASLFGATIDHADFTNANLEGANLDVARMHNAKGIMNVRPGGPQGASLVVNVRNGQPVFYMGGVSHSAEEYLEAMQGGYYRKIVELVKEWASQ